MNIFFHFLYSKPTKRGVVVSSCLIHLSSWWSIIAPNCVASSLCYSSLSFHFWIVEQCFIHLKQLQRWKLVWPLEVVEAQFFLLQNFLVFQLGWWDLCNIGHTYMLFHFCYFFSYIHNCPDIRKFNCEPHCWTNLEDAKKQFICGGFGARFC